MDTRKQTNYNNGKDASSYSYTRSSSSSSGYSETNRTSNSAGTQYSSRSERARRAAQLTRQQRQNVNRQAYAQEQNRRRQAGANAGTQARARGGSNQANNNYQRRQQNPANNRQSASQYSRRAGSSRGAYTSRNVQQYNAVNYRTRSPRHSSRRRRGWSAKRIIAFLIIVAIVIAAAVFFIKPQSNTGTSNNSASMSSSSSTAASTTTQEGDALPTPIMASCDGIKLHSSVSMQSLTEILIHNASYSYAKKLKTKLKEATNTEVMAAHGTGRIASEQPTGNKWMTGEFIRCYRSGNAGPKLSAIDCGGAVGTTVYAPVSGTVVKVKKYKLYDNPDYPDYQIHIQPEGRSDLDVVLIHLTHVTVKEGDHVEGGVTPMAKIRNVYKYIGNSMQLKSYTAKGDNGNHTHIQVNDATDKKYHGLD